MNSKAKAIMNQRSLFKLLAYFIQIPILVIVVALAIFALIYFNLSIWYTLIPLVYSSVISTVIYWALYTGEKPKEIFCIKIDGETPPNAFSDNTIPDRIQRIRRAVAARTGVVATNISFYVFPQKDQLPIDPRHKECTIITLEDECRITIGEKMLLKTSDSGLTGILAHEMYHLKQNDSQNKALSDIATRTIKNIAFMVSVVFLIKLGWWHFFLIYILLNIIVGIVTNLPLRVTELNADAFATFSGLGRELEIGLTSITSLIHKYALLDYFFGLISTHPSYRTRLKRIRKYRTLY